MLSLYLKMFIILVIGLSSLVLSARAQETAQSEPEAMYYRYLELASYVKGGSIEPHWMADGSSFWYAEGAPANTLIYKVDPNANTKTPLFDTAHLRQALTAVLGHESPCQGLPFEEFTFVDGEKAVKFTVEDKEFILQLDTYTVRRAPVLSEEEKSRLVPQVTPNSPWGYFVDVLSPDRRWFAGVKEHNLYLRSTYDGRRVPLTTDGNEDYWWDNEGATWSPNSLKLALHKHDYRGAPRVPIVHYLKPREEVEWVLADHFKAGDRRPRSEYFILELFSKQQIRIGACAEPGYECRIADWRPDGLELLLFRQTTDDKRLELIAADPKTGATRIVLTETQKTFVTGGERPPLLVLGRIFTWLPDGKGFLWLSERDGWRHLYLYDLEGNLIRRLTEGAWPVVRVVAVDEKSRWVYFTAHGDPQRPYDTHLYRVSLDGTGLARLTEATGQHEIQFAPSKQFFIDIHSTVARPPTVELRRADGTLLRILSNANIDALISELKWRSPEEFAVKAADGETDLYGALFKPYDFDPKRKYPVIEVIYASSRNTIVPRAFTAYPNYRGLAPALAQLGFITFMVDARGTPERSKAFRDVVYGSWARHEIPDHVATLMQLAEKRPYMDLTRVGIVGQSMGGYFATRALLLAPDVYHVGVASAGPAEARDVGATFIGPPGTIKEGYEHASNLRLAANLRGRLLLIHGTSDDTTPFSETMKMVAELIRANKHFDLLVMPGQGHSLWELDGSAPYWREAIRRYFQEHLKPEKVVLLSEEETSLK